MNLSRYTSRLNTILFEERFTLLHKIFQLFTMLSWMILLINSKAYYVVYLLVGICGLYCYHVLNPKMKDIFAKENRLNLIIASVFSLFIMGANYDLFFTVPTHFLKAVLEILFFPLLFVGGMFITVFILQYITTKFTSFFWEYHKYQWKPYKVFVLTFLVFTTFYSTVMFLCYYPGVISYDSVNQIQEGLSHTYSNSNPFFHTILIRFFINIGVNVFHDINVGVALYSVFSILFLSSCIAYCIVTLYQLYINKYIIIFVSMLYLLLPHHIMYSFTMWKDIPFSASILLFTVSLFRCIEKVGENQYINKWIVYLSGLGVCMFRGNGLIVFFIFLLLFAVWFGKEHRKMCISFACILAAALLITYPVLNAYGVRQSDSIELISMPIQQISRTIADGNDLTNEQKDLISNVVDINEIPNTYSPIISDPMKSLLRKSGNKDYIDKHKLEFAWLYIQVGMTHPRSYVTAWIDQTKGYWNAGYDYWRFSLECEPNNLGIKRTVASHFFERACDSFLLMYIYVDIIKPFVSIGLHLWIILLVAFVGYRKKNKLTVCLTIPCLAIVYTHMIGTPVFAEFRYVYALFCCVPFLVVIAFWRRSDCSDKLQSGQSK